MGCSALGTESLAAEVGAVQAAKVLRASCLTWREEEEVRS